MTTKSLPFEADTSLTPNATYTLYFMSGKKITGTVTHHQGRALKLTNATVKPRNQPEIQVQALTVNTDTAESFRRRIPSRARKPKPVQA